jgi:cell division septal protein FtsQ
MNIENERTKEKKQVLRNFMWATMFLSILLFAAMGILFYMLIPDLQISPNTEKLLLSVVSILSLAALFAWIFWYRLALKEYKREYKEELEKLEKSKMGIFFSGRVLFFLLLLSAVIGWYFYRIFG